MSNKKDSTHPSYGLVKFSRTMNSGARRLFGSALDNHGSTIFMTVHRALWCHNLYEDHYYETADPTLVEIELSAAQFAELLTTMNVGAGVPCTIRRVGKDHIENPPDIETEVERIRANFKDDLQDMIKTMQERRKDVEELTSKLPEKARREIKIALDVILQQMSSNIPFIATQFNEAAERVVTAAKQEIEAFTTHALRSAGMTALTEGDGTRQLQTVMGTMKAKK
jgi:hypothetical protein